MALSNLPYDDRAIVDGVKNVTVHAEQISQVAVNFIADDLSDSTTATVTATMTWVISSADAVRLLDAARPTGSLNPAGDARTLTGPAARESDLDEGPQWADAN
ncbi:MULTISPECIES: hypothetical protein [unclassified Curtobacterium]|uniref:hypothetical protein n=1 Tax=unclassified Curtobacterium TaxID=257496 RepID=UPI000DA0EF85|nr:MULTISPECIES: hypothetical protein [unclassified Curtobacterium]PYY31566.1 hypothetical protein DEI89_16795 [Curtobacterium sp. MCBD17_030]PZE34978.1 hypothetical protein DEJ31_12950 [Curtobacterium sp. MCPF17_031]PZF09720.1 hypothetical protein DEJ25_14095 [Curtobacterium sp. MCPF17_011]